MCSRKVEKEEKDKDKSSRLGSIIYITEAIIFVTLWIRGGESVFVSECLTLSSHDTSLNTL